MQKHRASAADKIWVEKADLNTSAFGAVVAVLAVCLPMFLI